MDFTDKTIIITGGTRGIGAAMVNAFSNAGANVVVTGTKKTGVETLDVPDSQNNIQYHQLDYSSTESVKEFISLVKGLDKVDVLINNAGIVREDSAKPIWEITDESWKIGIDVNLSTAFYCSREISKHMADNGGGKIVHVSSGFGFRGGRDNYIYAAGKGGIVNLTRAMATSLGRYGITTNCIVPGFIPTEVTDPNSDRSQQRGRFIPIGRVGQPSEMGPLAVYLASEASDYMNGEFFAIDGGGLAGGIAPTLHAPEIPLEI